MIFHIMKGLIKFEYEEMLNPDRQTTLDDQQFWNAGDQIEALKFYLKSDVEVVWSFKENDYSGSCYALLKYMGQYVLWRDGFGSCSGCDMLDGRDIFSGKDYIKSTFTEGNCKRFDTFADVLKFVTNIEDDVFWKYEDLSNLLKTNGVE